MMLGPPDTQSTEAQHMPAPDNLQVQTPGQPQASAEQSSSSTEQQATPLYTAKSNGGGRFKVWYTPADPAEQAGWFSDFVATGEGAKDVAQAEADRLNAGGQPFVKPEDQVQQVQQAQATVEAATQAGAEQVRPRRSQAVLTEEGWLVPDLPVAYTKE